MKLFEDVAPDILNMNNSKNVQTQGSNNVGFDTSVAVRTIDDTLQKITKQNLRLI